MKILSYNYFFVSNNVSAKDRSPFTFDKGILRSIAFSFGFFAITHSFLANEKVVKAAESEKRWFLQNTIFLTEKNRYKKHLDHPLLKEKAYKEASPKEKAELLKKAYLATKYDDFAKEQFVILFETVLGIGLVIGFAIFFPVMRYLAFNKPATFWKITNFLTWPLRTIFGINDLKKDNDIIMPKLKLIGEYFEGLSNFSLNSAYLFGDVVDTKAAYDAQNTKSIIKAHNTRRQNFQYQFYESTQNNPLYNLFGGAEIPEPNEKPSKQEVDDADTLLNNLNNKKVIWAKQRGMQSFTSLLESLTFYIIFRFMLKTPVLPTRGVSLFLWPMIGVPYFLILFFYSSYTTRIKYPFRAWWYRENKFFVDPLEDLELLYVAHQPKLSVELQNTIENMFFEARKFPDKAPYLKEFIEKVIWLPTPDEVTGTITDLPEKPDLSKFENYPPEVQEKVERIYHRYRNGIKMDAILLFGPAGTGKSELVSRLANITNAAVAIVPLTGKTQKELRGEAGQGKNPGKLGLIAEAIANAAAQQKSAIFLFFEEGGQALSKDNKHRQEIEQLLLEILDPNTSTIKNPALNGYPIPLPVIIVMTSNDPIEGSIANRLKIIDMPGFSWEAKKRIIFEDIGKYCEEMKLDPETLEDKDFKAIEHILYEMEQEDPQLEKYPGLRQPILRVKEYLEEKKNKKYFEKARKAIAR